MPNPKSQPAQSTQLPPARPARSSDRQKSAGPQRSSGPQRSAGPTRPPTGGPATRERILAYLQENRLVSVHTLSRDWGLTRADIRYHLNALLEEGIIELAPRDPAEPAKRGRPTQQYRLSHSSAPDNLPALCSVLLDQLLGRLDQVEQENVLQSVAQAMAGDPLPAGTPTQRFTQAVAYLNQHGYRARWEAHASGPRLLLRACPYAVLLARHSELCAMDRQLLEQLVRLPLHQAARMNFVTGRPPACIFASGPG